jgi:hypothetical protein
LIYLLQETRTASGWHPHTRVLGAVRSEEHATSVSRQAQAQHFGHTLDLSATRYGMGPSAGWLSMYPTSVTMTSSGCPTAKAGEREASQDHWTRGDAREPRSSWKLYSPRLAMAFEPWCESNKGDSNPCGRLCYCCLLTNCCLCLPLARRTSGDDWADGKRYALMRLRRRR